MIPFFVLGQVGIGTTISSILEIKSNSKGLLIPRVSLLSTNDILTVPTLVTSLLVYNNSSINDVTPGFYYWYTIWKPLKTTINPSSGTGWNLGGNNISSTDFIGTTNYSSLQFKVNNTFFGRFPNPNGGIAVGIGANTNDYNSIAIGTNANSTTSTQAIAIENSANALGYLSTAIGYQATANNSAFSIGKQCISSGYQSVAIGVNANSSNNNSIAFGTTSIASGQQSMVLGNQATAIGQNATALCNMSLATQDNSIILGDSSNNNSKIGIGTNTPEERLHIVGSLKLVDGTQGNGFILASDATGKSHWQNQNSLKNYANIYYSGSGQTVNQFNNIIFGSTNISTSGLSITNDGITVPSSGIYKIVYQIALSKTTGNNSTVSFNLYKNFNTLIPGSLGVASIGNNQSYSLSSFVIVSLNACDKISVKSNNSDNNIQYLPNGLSLTIELIQ